MHLPLTICSKAFSENTPMGIVIMRHNKEEEGFEYWSDKSLDFKIEEDLVGGASYEKHKKPITDEVFYKALESEVVMLGAVGGPKWDGLDLSLIHI